VGRVTAVDCTEWRGLMAMDAIGQASEDESSRLEEHLSQCETCRADARQVRGAANALALVDRASVDGHLVGGSPPPSVALAALPSEDGPAEHPVGNVPVRGGHRRRWVAVGTVAAAVAVAVAFLVIRAPVPPVRTVALSGQPGVRASISLSGQKWGTRATLRESGQVGGQVLTVSMQAVSGRWWVAGSYRTVGGRRPVTVELSCAVPAKEVTAVWVRDAQGHTVLDGYP
jgi:hypothetical protein